MIQRLQPYHWWNQNHVSVEYQLCSYVYSNYVTETGFHFHPTYDGLYAPLARIFQEQWGKSELDEMNEQPSFCVLSNQLHNNHRHLIFTTFYSQYFVIEYISV